MSKYSMPDGTIVDTDNASKHWEEETRWNGNNHISMATGTQWDHQALYRRRLPTRRAWHARALTPQPQGVTKRT
ncbi:MAG: hypothetical protein HYZ29_23450 [Myxococcales bacterium]|nr:hypothetical protein [Myxococcales bacterium]